MAKCRACRRDALVSEFCPYHEQASDALKKNYDVWVEAYGKISWKEYLERLLELKEAGPWVKDVITFELKEKKGV